MAADTPNSSSPSGTNSTGRRPGRPPSGRTEDFTVGMKPELREQFKEYCRSHKINASALFEQWVMRELDNPSQPELASA